MRAILIDPVTKTLSEVQTKGYENKDFETILQCKAYSTDPLLRNTISKGFDIMASDDALDDRDDPYFCFQIDADDNPPSSFPIAGRGLVVGVAKHGETCDLRMSVEDLTRRITFTSRRPHHSDRKRRNEPGVAK
jgi:hypothetical protein